MRHTGYVAPQKSPTPPPVVGSPPPDADSRIRQLEDKLKRYGMVKDEVIRLRQENDRLRAELRVCRTPPREGVRCPTCGQTAGVKSPRGTSTPIPAARPGRSQSVADGSPRKKALPAAPPDSDEEDDTPPPVPATAKPSGLLNVRHSNQRPGSVLKALDPADIKRQMFAQYGRVDLQGNESLIEEEDEGESDDSDAPEPPPKPAGFRSSSPNLLEKQPSSGSGSEWASSSPRNTSNNVPKLTLGSNTTMGRKSPRTTESQKASIPSIPPEERRESRSEGMHGQHTSDARHTAGRISNNDVSDRSSAEISAPEARKFGSISKGTSMMGLFRRGANSFNQEDSSNQDTDDIYHSMPSDFGSSNRAHSMLDQNESLRWRKLAGMKEEGGAGAIALTPINVTTINKTIYYLVRVEGPDETSWVVPRTYEQFRDFRQNLLFEFPSASVPQPPSRLFKGNVKEKTVGDRLTWLQTFLDSLLKDRQLAASVLLLKFLDPFYRPSPLALRAIAPTKEGPMQYRSDKTSGKGFRSMLCVLKHDLYIFRSQEDQTPFEVCALDYCTIDLIPDGNDIPRFAFQVVSLKEGDSFEFAAASSKELADWILNIREEKTKRVNFCQNEAEVVFPTIEVAEKKRVETRALLSDYAFDTADEKSIVSRIQFPKGFNPPSVKPEPDTGLSVDVKGGIIASTAVKLLHVVFNSKKCEASFISVFFVAFRSFSSPIEVLAYFIKKYATKDPVIQDRCKAFLDEWFRNHMYDFLDSMILTQVLLDFMVLRISQSEAAPLKTMLAKHLRFAPSGDPSSFPMAIMPPIFRGAAFDILDLAPLELARQITLIQHSMFAKINARELLQDYWTGPEGDVRAPHVTAFIANFNHLCGWVTSLIVCTRPPIPRIALIHRFIDIAKCCLELQNFNGTMAIVGALLSNPVHRLKEDWVSIPKDSQDTFAELKALFQTSGNFKSYRAALSVCAPPCVPYMGLYLQDLTFLEANKDTKVVATITMINVEKSDKISNIINEIHKFQPVPYDLRPMPAVQAYVLRGAVLSREEQDAKSYLIRPRHNSDAGKAESPRRVVWKKEYGSPRRDARAGDI